MNFRKVSDALEVLKEKNCRNNIQLITLDGKKSGVTNNYDELITMMGYLLRTASATRVSLAVLCRKTTTFEGI